MEAGQSFKCIVSLAFGIFEVTHPFSSLGHSKKGYTNGEIGIEWIKHFDQHTKVKANGHVRLLLVDGHNSHYT